MNTKKFTILHSNDMHGDFLAEMRGGESGLIGGLSLLAGYVNKVRKEEENVLYIISGDMLQGSLIDSEYKGVSTIEIMNYLSPDIATLGNHEFDYGLPHLLFLEKMANFPIVNANLYIKKYQKRLMQPYHIINKAGFDILFIGIITEKVIDSLATDKMVASFITLEEASNEVGKIANAYRNDDIDLTILLTHIGYESDIALAKLLQPEWGVDIIIGGHSHTVLEKPTLVNNILITQAGVGTDQIGRFDIVVDDDTNSIVEWDWKLIDINDKITEPDKGLEGYINSFKEVVDRKYNTILCKFSETLTHPKREEESALGNLFADILAESLLIDVAFVASGSIRTKELGPLVTLGSLMTCFPYDDSVHRFTIKGKKLKKIFNHIMRPENRTGEGEYYQVNKGVRAIYSDTNKELLSLSVKGKIVEDDEIYTISLQDYHYKGAEKYLNITNEELNEIAPSKVVTTSVRDVLEEYLRKNQNLTSKVEGRLIQLP